MNARKDKYKSGEDALWRQEFQPAIRIENSHDPASMK